jgi:hypothetical protein
VGLFLVAVIGIVVLIALAIAVGVEQSSSESSDNRPREYWHAFTSLVYNFGRREK